MKKYKVCFTGFAYVEAESADEAQDAYEFDYAYMEQTVVSCDEVDEFVVMCD